MSALPGGSTDRHALGAIMGYAGLAAGNHVVVAGGIEFRSEIVGAGLIEAVAHEPANRIAAGIVISDNHDPRPLRSAIVEVARRLGDAAALVLLLQDTADHLGAEAHRMLMTAGYRIDAGVRCRQGFVMVARRARAVRYSGGHRAAA